MRPLEPGCRAQRVRPDELDLREPWRPYSGPAAAIALRLVAALAPEPRRAELARNLSLASGAEVGSVGATKKQRPAVRGARRCRGHLSATRRAADPVSYATPNVARAGPFDAIDAPRPRRRGTKRSLRRNPRSGRSSPSRTTRFKRPLRSRIDRLDSRLLEYQVEHQI